jgi:hypothetical protein
MMSEVGIHHAEVEIRFCERLMELFRQSPDYFTRRRGAIHG